MKYLYIILFSCLINTLSAQSSYNLSMTTELVGNKLNVKLYLSFDVEDGLGSANLRFTFGAGINDPILLSHNLVGDYIGVTVTEPIPGTASFNTIFFAGTGTTIPAGIDPITEGLEVATIQFDVVDDTQTPDLTWATPIAFNDALPQGLLTANILNNSQNVLLPVKLIGFYAQKEHQSIQLEWATGNEEQNAGFEIQRSTREGPWETLGFVRGQGFATTEQQYDFKDISPYDGVNYYRLKQLDLDGQFEYSDVISIDFVREFTGALFPNPSSDWISIQHLEQEGIFQIFDSTGRSIKSGRFDGDPIPVTDLRSGTYHLQLGRKRWTFVKS